jgi:ELP3 family radical SAM enzyme/protein acetyltransferase
VRNQFKNRIKSYLYTGNIRKEDTNSKKMEVILSGGTWESYPLEYREQVMNELYWAANTVDADRPMRSLEEEIEENETGNYRIIGLTIETRPDNITDETIQQYCRWGVTRIQIGVQHYNDAILKKINRKCYTDDTIRAIRLLKQSCFKVVVHLMPDLPGSSPEEDIWMFRQAIENPDLQFDDVKIYPTAVCKSPDPDRIVKSKIAEWYAQGLYKPYAEENLDELIRVISYYKKNVQPWVRIQRIVRDIPGKSIESGYKKKTNLRQMIQAQTTCNCIFCKEIGEKEFDGLEPTLVVRTYAASQGTEYFLSYEAHNTHFIKKYLIKAYLWILDLVSGKRNYWSGSKDSYLGLFGFLRLRLDPNPGGGFLPDIRGCALIREVHVYGSSLGVGKDAIGSQHRGYGKKLVQIAEQIALDNGYYKTAVIAGVGTREYYKNKCGYTKQGTFMVKELLDRDNLR